MTRTRSFQTAAARRRQDPLVWEIDGEQIELRSSVELADIGLMLEPMMQSSGDTVSLPEVAKKRRQIVDVVTAFIAPGSRDRFLEMVPDIDTAMLGEMLQELIEEYSGVNPTQPSSSSDGA